MDIKYRVVFYTDQAGRSTIEDYIMELNSRSDKESRIKLNKVAEYIRRLQCFGTSIGKPTMVHIEGTELWELRPLQDRIFFALWKDDSFVLLHLFTKKSQKTPRAEVAQALRNLKDWRERYGNDNAS